MSLAHVAHVGTRPFRRGNARRAFGDHGSRFVPHPGEHLANQVGVKGGQAHVAAAHDLVRDGRQQEPHRRAHAGVARHQEAVQPQLVGQSGRVNRRRSPERDDRAALDALAPLDRVGPRGVGHVLVHHLAHAQRGHPGVEAQLSAHAAPDRRLGPAPIQRNRAAGEQLRVDPPQNHVRIGHGGLFPAPPVRRRTRLGPRARRPHMNAVQIVHPRNRPAPGADLDHLDHRNPHGQPAALLEAVAARYLEGAGVKGLAAVDHAQLGRRASHVEREHVAQIEGARQMARQNRPAGRAGLDETDRGRHGRVERGQAAPRCHEQEGAVKPGVAQRRRQTPEIARHQRLNVGVGASRRRAFVLADFGAHLGGEGHGQIRALTRQNCGNAPLVGGVGIAMDERDRNGFHPVLPKCRQERAHPALVQRNQDAAVPIHALRHRQTKVARDQRGGPVHADVVLLEAVLVGHLQGIPVPRCRDQRGARALPLDDGVGGQRGPVYDQANGRGGNRGNFQDLGNRLQDTPLRRGVGGEDLGGHQAATGLECYIGERAADVDGDAGRPTVRGHVNGPTGRPGRRRAAARCS